MLAGKVGGRKRLWRLKLELSELLIACTLASLGFLKALRILGLLTGNASQACQYRASGKAGLLPGTFVLRNGPKEQTV